MASCTSVFTGVPPIAGVDMLAIEVPAACGHTVRAAPRANYFDSICVKHPQIRYGTGPLRGYGVFRIPTVCA
jgi:hypothetical protein